MKLAQYPLQQTVDSPACLQCFGFALAAGSAQCPTECPGAWDSPRGALIKPEEWARGLQLLKGAPGSHCFLAPPLFPSSSSHPSAVSSGAPPCLQADNTLSSLPSSWITHCHNIVNIQISLKETLRSDDIDENLEF